MNMSRWWAVALLLSMAASPAVAVMMNQLTFDGAPRAVYFDRVIATAQLRGDGPGEDHLRRLALEPPALPMSLTPELRRHHPSYADYYENLQVRLKDGMTYRDYAAVDQWRVDKAEADLALVAWELRKGRRASTSLMGDYLWDASWALNCHIGVTPRVTAPVAPVPRAVVAAAPTAGITANPVRVLSGQNTRLTWQTSNATSASINGRAVALSGSELRTVSTATDYVLTAHGTGGEATSRASVAVFDAPTATISALPARVAAGATTVVQWSTENATTARVNGRNVALRGSENMTIASPSEFVLVAFGEGGEATAKANVAVFDVPTATISALPAQVAPGATTVVRWSTENATTARVNGRNVALRGSENVTVNVASEFVIVATGAGGEATAKALVNTFAPPTANLSASEKSIERGQSSVLSWRTTNADRILLNGESVSSSGNRSVSPSQTENYLLTATGPGGRAEDRTSIAVTTPPAPVVAASPRLFRIHFDFDEWAIRGDAMDTMSQIASFMRQNPWTRMIVLGHTDARGSEDYNIVLGEERARSVRDYFLAQFGLDASRFTLESRGEAAPIAPNSFLDGRDNPDGRALNRRAEFIEIR